MNPVRRHVARRLAPFVLGWVSVSTTSRAEERRDVPWTTILVRDPSCKTGLFAEGSFDRLLQMELQSEHIHVSKDDVGISRELTVEIQAAACEADARVWPIVLRSENHRPIERSIALGDVAFEARPRAFALAVAELIRSARATWKAADEPPAARPEVPPPVLVIVVSGAEPPRQSSSVPELEATAAWRVFTRGPTSMLGGRVASMLPFAPFGLRARADASGAWAGASNALGTVTLSCYSGGLAFLAQVPGPPTLLLGPHVELGYAYASGALHAPGMAASGGGIIATTSFVAATNVAIHRPWQMVFELEAGFAFLGLDALSDNEPIAAIHGGFAAVRAGIAFVP